MQWPEYRRGISQIITKNLVNRTLLHQKESFSHSPAHRVSISMSLCTKIIVFPNPVIIRIWSFTIIALKNFLILFLSCESMMHVP